VPGYIQRLATSARGTVVASEWNQLAVYEAVDGAQRFRVSVPLYAMDLAVRPGLHDVVTAVVVGQDSGGCGPLAVRTYDLAGEFRWSRLVAAEGSCGGSPLGQAVTVLDGGEVVVGGTVTVPSDFGLGLRTPEGASDDFILGLAP
jgi:hypothetical protein